MLQEETAIQLRPARREDIPGLLVIEQASFNTDRLGHAQFRRFIAGGKACVLVAQAGAGGHLADGLLAGYVLVLFRAGSRKARIYSIAVAAAARGIGVGEQLLLRAEDAARRQGCSVMRLEVRPDNAAALAMYARHGYLPFGRYAGFYEDGSDAVRLQKNLLSADLRAG